MGGILIRPAKPGDEAVVLDLIEELFASPGVPPGGYTRERGRKGFQYALKRDDAEILLAIAGSAPVGLASVYVDFQAIRYGLRCYLQDLIVTSVRRSEGIGALLLAAPDLALPMLGRQHVARVCHAEWLEDALLGEALDRRTADPSHQVGEKLIVHSAVLHRLAWRAGEGEGTHEKRKACM